MASVHTLTLPELGTYRVLATGEGSPRSVAGLPVGDVDETIASLVQWELLATLIAVAGADNAGVSTIIETFGPRGDAPSIAAVKDVK